MMRNFQKSGLENVCVRACASVCVGVCKSASVLRPWKIQASVYHVYLKQARPFLCYYFLVTILKNSKNSY